MSIAEQIAELELEKLACMKHFDAIIENLQHLERVGIPSDGRTINQTISQVSRISLTGKSLSETIIEDRGSI